MKKLTLPAETLNRIYPDTNDNDIVVASIHPAEFIRLAAYCPDKPESFNHRLVGSWEDWPKLLIDPEERICIGHEGRHRVAALLNAGYESVDIVVEITPNPRRFENDIAAMLAWKWGKALPVWAEIRSEDEWLQEI